MPALEQAGGDPALLYQHCFGAGEHARASRYAEQAGDRAAESVAFQQAAEMYRFALESDPGDSLRAMSLLERRARALSNAGHCAEAADLFLELAAQQPRNAIRLRIVAMEHLLASGHFTQGEAVLRRVLAELDLTYPRTPGRAFARSLWLMAQLRLRAARFGPGAPGTPGETHALQMDACFSAAKGLIGSDSMRGSYFAFAALTIALRHGDGPRRARYLGFVGAAFLAAAGGRLGSWGVSLLDRASELAERSADPFSTGMISMCRGQAEIMAGRWAVALTASDRAAALFSEQCRGATWERNFSEMGALRALEELGRFAEGGDRAEGLLADAKASGDLYAEATARINRALLVHLAHDDVSAARDDARLALARWTPEGYHVQHLYSLRVELMADLYQGEPARAWDRLQSEWQAIQRSFLLRVPTGRIDVLLMRARVALALARSRASSSVLKQCAADARALRREARPDAAAHAAVIEAALSIERSPRSSLALLATAQQQFSRLGMQLYAGCVAARRAQLGGGEVAARVAELSRCSVQRAGRWLSVDTPGFDSIEQ